MGKTALLCLFLISAVCAKKCVVPLGVKDEWPLIFHENGSFYPSELINEEEFAIIANKDYVVLSCSPNHFKESPEVKKIIATCRNGNLTGGTLAPRANLACSSSPVLETITNVPHCPAGRTPVRFGYVHPIDNSAHIIGEACYSTEEGRTLFAHVHLGSEQFTALEILDKSYLTQKKPDLRYKANFMYAFYRKVHEFADLKNLPMPMEVPNLETTNFVDYSLLQNVQLAPVNELNWNFVALNSGIENFKMLKKDIRDLEDDIDVYIGSYGVFTLKGANYHSGLAVYLDSEKFPVPELLWFVVRKGSKATAFVVFNDPTITQADVSKNAFCDDKCNAISWLHNTKPYDLSKGAVLCCEYDELRAKVDELPDLAGISELFV